MKADVRHTAIVAVAACLVAAPATPVAAGAECPNEETRAHEPGGYALRLAGCRAYEQVSPANKNAVDALGATGFVRATPTGEPARVTYYSLAPFPSAPGISEVPGSGDFPTYLGSRSDGSERWTTKGLLPPSAPETIPQVLGMTEDLTEALVSSSSPLLVQPPPETTPGAPQDYVRDTVTGAYSWLAGAKNGGVGVVTFAGASANDSRIFFQDTATKLVPGVPDPEEAPFLYEWSAAGPPGGQIAFIGFVDGTAPQAGTFVGSGPPPPEGKLFYAQHAVSEDGERVFFTDYDEENRRVYLREPRAGRTIQVSAGEATWLAATPDGRYAFYLEGQNLYRFDAISQASSPLTSGAAGVLGMLGTSNDGSYAYFAASSVLAANAHAGKPNIYEWHDDGTVTFVTSLRPGGNEGDESDWRDFVEPHEVSPGILLAPGGGGKSARVTPSGTTLLFSSKEKLTSYENAGNYELYLYDATRPLPSQNPVCVSCNPLSAAATANAALLYRTSEAAPGIPLGVTLTRNLSTDGSRVFFDSAEALVPGDINGTVDVYQWERAASSGAPGTCTPSSEGFQASSGGCLSLISTGVNPAPSYFGDASADGSDVFFFTRQALAGQDQDNNADLYDARVDGGMLAQNPPPPPQPCGGETECRLPSPTPPPLSTPASATFAGAEDDLPPHPHRAAPTRQQRLAKALRACRKKKRGSRRRRCEARAERRYGTARQSPHRHVVVRRRRQ